MLRARYRAEARYRSYGVISLAISTVFLIALMSNIMVTAWPAFWSHYLVVDVPLKAEGIDPENTRTKDVLRNADYMAVIRNALDEAIPGIEGRVARKQLREILSSGAADDVRARVLADPGLIGKTVKLPLLLSDDADLFMKGVGTHVERTATRGTASPSVTAGEATILTSGDDFAPLLVEIKKDVAERASALRQQADRLEVHSGEGARDSVAQLRAEAGSAAGLGVGSDVDRERLSDRAMQPARDAAEWCPGGTDGLAHRGDHRSYGEPTVEPAEPPQVSGGLARGARGSGEEVVDRGAWRRCN